MCKLASVLFLAIGSVICVAGCAASKPGNPTSSSIARSSAVGSSTGPKGVDSKSGVGQLHQARWHAADTKGARWR